MIRIACRELENWHLGDLAAVEKLYPESRAVRLAGKKKFREPDQLNGTEEMKNLSKAFSKTTCARDIVQHMNLEQNQSTSFQHLLIGLKQFLNREN